MDVKPELNHTEIDIPAELRQQVTITTLERIYNWGRSNSLWPMMFGLACCAIEMICTAASRYDFSRFGMEVMRPSPRQADVMIVAGTVTKKMLPNIIRLYNQMSLPGLFFNLFTSSVIFSFINIALLSDPFCVLEKTYFSLL